MDQELLAYFNAVDIISQIKLNLQHEMVSVEESLGRVIQEDISTQIESPQWNTSAMDGFAVNSLYTKFASNSNPIKIKLIGLITAGDKIKILQNTEECFQINTGAPIPKGADAVVKVEDVSLINGEILCTAPVYSDLNIIRKGDYGNIGEIVIKSGQIICAQDIAFLKSQGIFKIKVSEKIVVSIIASGNELIPIFVPDHGKIVETNSLMIKQIITNSRCEVQSRGIVEDKVDQIINEVKESILDSHVTIIIGGTSKGTKDLVPDSLDKIDNSEKIFHGVKIKPGKPFGVWKINNQKLIFLSPGPPYASFLTTKVFIEPFLQICTVGNRFLEIGGHIDIVLENSVKVNSGRSEFLRVKLNYNKQQLVGKIIGIKGSGDFIATCKADAILIPNSIRTEYLEGETITAFLIRPVPIYNDRD
ncbi:MAG: Molybdopterin molybdenumtransferase [Candidatus Heimdallarchaeota archaeon LC_2]|nr:MAG: Molybdopterin molybdenumtransferase [Candidatus Heimdallarchaeota archaeon LC_2]